MNAQFNIPAFLPGFEQVSFGPKSRAVTGKNIAATFENVLNTARNKSVYKGYVGRRGQEKEEKCDYMESAGLTETNKNEGFSVQSKRRMDKISGVNWDSSTSTTGKSSNTKELAENKRELENRVDWVIEGISMVLGIGVDELRALMASLNIRTDNLIDRISLAKSAQKLSSLSGLDNEHTQTIAKIFDRVFSMADILAGELEIDSEVVENIKKEFDLAVPTNPNEALIEDGNWVRHQKVETSETLNITMMKIKLKLQEMTHRFKEAPESMYADIEENLRMLSALKNIPLKSTDLSPEESGAADHPILNQEVSSKVIDKRMESEGSSWLSSNDKEEISFMEKGQQVDEVHDGEFILDNPIIWKAPDGEIISQVKTYTLKEHIPKMEIVNQVINKAKVILNGGKSEMVLQLKPESLGRLSLKVVSENGIVTAKFITENQQVKQVLETNLQALRNALEEQGLNVQGFSVFIRQDLSNEHGWDGRLIKPNKISQAGKIEEDVAEAGYIAESGHRLNPYEWSESTIDLIV